MTFLNDYFLDKKDTIHCVGECENEKAFVLPFNIKKDFSLTKCGLTANEMEYFPTGALSPAPGLIFCKNCIK